MRGYLQVEILCALCGGQLQDFDVTDVRRMKCVNTDCGQFDKIIPLEPGAPVKFIHRIWRDDSRPG